MTGASWLLVLTLTLSGGTVEAEGEIFETWASCQQAARATVERLLLEWEAVRRQNGRMLFQDVNAMCLPVETKHGRKEER